MTLKSLGASCYKYNTKAGLLLPLILCVAAHLAFNLRPDIMYSFGSVTNNALSVHDIQNMVASSLLANPTRQLIGNDKNQTVVIASSTSDMVRHSKVKQPSGEYEPFCVPWNVSSDEWWTHHADWEVFFEDDTHYCFNIIPNLRKRHVFQTLYQNQFLSDCSVSLTRPMWSSGLGADITNVVDGIYEGLHKGQPFQVHNMPWHYASPKPFNISTAACPLQNMFCYFLNISNCPARKPKDRFCFDIGKADPKKDYLLWYFDYVWRMQTWFRKKVYDLRKRQRLNTPCTAIHVRRADVVDHDDGSRAYHKIATYIKAAKTQTLEPNVLILTDDHNAIGEALVEFPELNWFYINRTRYRGFEGGWEMQIPSNDASFELAVLFVILRMVRECNGLVRSYSNLGDLMEGQMRLVNESIWSERVEDFEKGQKIHSLANKKTVAISKSYNVSL